MDGPWRRRSAEHGESGGARQNERKTLPLGQEGVGSGAGATLVGNLCA
jgi:hypothetical protein